MGINKILYGEKTLIDLSKDTVTPDKMVEGTIGHNHLGEEIIGTHQCEKGIGNGEYVWAIYDTKQEWNYTVKNLGVSGTSAGYDTKSYAGMSITEDGYWYLNAGTSSGTTYYLPTGVENGKAKTILAKSAYSATSPYSTYTIEDTSDTVKGNNILGYISDSSASAYPENGLQNNKYYICIMGDDSNLASNKMLNGVIGYGKTGKVTGTILSQEAQTITPGTADKTISSGKYLSGTQTIKGDTNLISGNIKKDISIFGVTGTLESSNTEVDKTGNGEYVWRKCSPEIGWVESRKDTGSTTKPSGYSSTGYTSFTVTNDGYYKLSNGSVTLSEFYLPSNASNGSTKTILYKPYMSNYQIWTISDEKGETGKKGDVLYGYVSSTEADAYPNDGVQDHHYYSMIFSPSANTAPAKMLKDTIAFGQSGKVTGTISSLGSQTIIPSKADQKINAGQYLSGTQTIKGDANLLAKNIKNGVSIFGVTGSYAGESSGGSKTAKGTITGAGTSPVTIETGLESISTFVLYRSSVGSNGLLLYLNNDGTETKASVEKTTYWAQVSVISGTVSMDGGSVTYTPSSSKITVLADGATYNWIAIE